MITAATTSEKFARLIGLSAECRLIRAQVKILMNRPDYCDDARTAVMMGITDAMQQLGVKCD